jgi:hypothetical protein
MRRNDHQIAGRSLYHPQDFAMGLAKPQMMFDVDITGYIFFHNLSSAMPAAATAFS